MQRPAALASSPPAAWLLCGLGTLRTRPSRPAVSRCGFDPERPSSAGPILGSLHSISGGERKGSM